MLPNQLALYFDPADPLPPARRRLFWAMYRFNVAWADDRLGRLIQALRSSGEWDRTLLVVTSTHGEEFGEKGQILNGGNLGRQLLEVPFAVKLPLGFRRKIAEPPERRVAAARLWATLVEAAGGEVPPAVAPSLFRRAPARRALRALPGQRHQPASRSSTATTSSSGSRASRRREPEYYLARLAMMNRGNARIARAELAVPPEEILGRLRAAFAAAPPLSGDGAPRLTLERWDAEGGASRWRTRGARPSWPAGWRGPGTRSSRRSGRRARRPVEWYTAESP